MRLAFKEIAAFNEAYQIQITMDKCKRKIIVKLMIKFYSRYPICYIVFLYLIDSSSKIFFFYNNWLTYICYAVSILNILFLITSIIFLFVLSFTISSRFDNGGLVT